MRILKEIKLNIRTLFKVFLYFLSGLLSILSIILTFVSWEEMKVTEISYKIYVLITMLLISSVIAIIYILLLKRKNTIWSNGSNKIIVRYADLMRIAFPKRNKEERIVVIPVNTSFDTIVDNDIAAVDKPLVSSKTIHGMWINKMISKGFSLNELDERIEEYIRIKNIVPKNTLQRERRTRGKLLVYEQGSIVAVRGKKNVTYFLLALSDFDENNNAHCTKEELIECIHKLIIYYNETGQGFDMYLPLMGTNRSRVGLSCSDSLNVIISVLKLYSDKVNGCINVVVYSKDKDKVAINN